jgi:hypothetical protein
MEVVVHLWRSHAASSSRIDCIDQCEAASALNETGSVTTSRLLVSNRVRGSDEFCNDLGPFSCTFPPRRSRLSRRLPILLPRAQAEER